jgi:hypothetical protein
LSAIDPSPYESPRSGRRQLAEDLVRDNNPLTRRVIVNRLWHHLFGRGLVRTPDNFGRLGDEPTHPELLDWLAVRLEEEGWSLKKMIRLITTSRTWQLSSRPSPTAQQQDPENRWLSHANVRRLEAEAIRDAMLAVSGELDRSRPAGSLVGRVIMDRPISLIGLDKRLPSDLDGSLHRSVYLPVIRDRLPDVLDLFDFAEPSQVTGTRETTNVPTQALYLMNSPFVQDRAAAFAARLPDQAEDPRQRVRLAFQWCYNRLPDADEEARSLKFFKQGLDPSAKSADTADRWTSFCQAIPESPGSGVQAHRQVYRLEILGQRADRNVVHTGFCYRHQSLFVNATGRFQFR